jgi:hypothetical protein
MLPGRIGVTIHERDKTWRFQIAGGKQFKVDSLPRAPEEAQISGISSYRGADKLPAPPGFYYSGPYLVSPNNQYIVATLTEKTRTPIWPTAFLIAGHESRAVVSNVKQLNNARIYGVAWAPNSQYVAILEGTFQRKWWLPHVLISILVAHPLDHVSFRITIVNLSGDLMVRAEIKDDFAGGSGEIVWTP